MIKLILAATAAASFFAAPAEAQTPLAFTWQGHKIVGTVDQIGDTQVIKGQDVTTGRDFELHVRRGYVEGQVGGDLVAYPVPRHGLSTASAG